MTKVLPLPFSFTGPSPSSPDQLYYKKHPNSSFASVNHSHRITATTGGSRISTPHVAETLFFFRVMLAMADQHSVSGRTTDWKFE